MTNPKIYFICPQNKFASGGVKQIYKMVEILNNNGFNAVLLLKKNGKEKWFNSKVSIETSPYLFKKIKYSYTRKKINFWRKIVLHYLKLKSLKFQKNAILVFPEIYGPNISSLEPEIQKVIFNQNCYYSFEHFSLFDDVENNIYKNPKLIATIVASNDAKKYLKFAFPKIRIKKMRLGIDENIFTYSSAKKKQIAFMPRKLQNDVVQVINILKSRHKIDDWEFVPIENKSEKEVAEIMKESAIFLSFNHKEGFGLPPAEAMACGCIVIGYKGQGGKDYFNENYSYPIDDGDISTFAETIEKVATEFFINESSFLKKGKETSDFILNEFNLDNEEQDTLKAWRSILEI
jgi:glycosyltransferase involved in cell wall biosynthesis